MHKECVTPGFGDSCICPECIERVKEKARRCWTQGCDNILTTAFVFCKECRTELIKKEDEDDERKSAEAEQSTLRMGPEGSKMLSEDDPLLDRITALEASVAILGKVVGEQEKTIENMTSCLAGTIETIELLRKLGE